MNGRDQTSSSANWTWRPSIEVALMTLLLIALLSLVLDTLLQGISNLANIQILGTPIGTAILGASEALLLIPLLLYSKRLGICHSQFAPRAQNWRQGLSDIGAGALMGIAMVPTSIVLSIINEMALGQQPGAEYLKNAFTVTSPFEAVLLLSVVVLVVAPSEEVISRGFIQQGLEKSFGRIKGLLVASLIFAIIHLSLWSSFPLLCLGMMLGLIFQLRHYRVLAPIAAHAVYMICLVIINSI